MFALRFLKTTQPWLFSVPCCYSQDFKVDSDGAMVSEILPSGQLKPLNRTTCQFKTNQFKVLHCFNQAIYSRTDWMCLLKLGPEVLILLLCRHGFPVWRTSNFLYFLSFRSHINLEQEQCGQDHWSWRSDLKAEWTLKPLVFVWFCLFFLHRAMSPCFI